MEFTIDMARVGLLAVIEINIKTDTAKCANTRIARLG